LFVGNQLAMGKLFEELRASGSVRSGERSCQSSYPLRRNNKHTDIRTLRLQVKPKAISFSRVRRPYTWGSKGRSLRTVRNWVSAYYLL